MFKNERRNWNTHLLNTLSSASKNKSLGISPNLEVEALQQKLQ